MILRKGKTKSLLEKSIDCALLAVEIYNKPRTPFRVESYITLMIMAWTKLFHSHFNHTIGSKYYYKEKNGRYKLIDGGKKTWELKTCISKFNELDDAQKANLIFFIKLRNKIEHRHIEKDDIGVIIFGECQSMLYNYESILVKLFGEEYALNTSLAFSLQFSRLRTRMQMKSSRTMLSKEVKDLKIFIDKYRKNISDDIFSSQEYSIKLIQIPKISNTNRNDLAIEFVNWSLLNNEDRENYEKLSAIIKDKVVTKEVANPGKLKPGEVKNLVNGKITIKINHYDLKCLYYMFSIRPTRNDDNADKFNTNTNYCHYDEVHNDYVYQTDWVEFLIENISTQKLTKEIWVKNYKARKKLKLEDFVNDNGR